MTIEVQGLTKHFGAVTAANGVSLRVEEGGLMALLGPSGSGKTTVLRMIAGLENPDAGSITIGGIDVTDLPAQKRHVGFVFQHYALFKHMRVADNIAFPLKVRHWRKDAVRERVAELVSLLRLEGLERRYPDEVSGGQQQRVALARALAARPEVLLLDEPFSALDARVREELRDWLRGLHDQLQVTSLFVTHDQTEAIELADRIAIMRDGVLVQSGAAAEIEEEPNSAFVMNFLGKASTVRGLAKDGVADFYGVTAPYEAASNGPVPVVGHFRPQQVGITLEPTSTSWPVVVDRLVAAGHAVKLNLSIVETDESFVAEISGWQRDELGLEAGRLVHATPWNLRVYPTADAEKGLRTLDPASASA